MSNKYSHICNFILGHALARGDDTYEIPSEVFLEATQMTEPGDRIDQD